MSHLIRPIAVTLFLACAAAAAYASPITIGVSPPRFEIEIGDRQQTHAMKVFNFGSVPAEIEVSVYAWDLDENGQLKIVDAGEQALDRWIVINPLRFTVGPHESQSVRFAVRPRVQPTAGEHRAIVYMQQKPIRSEARSGAALSVLGRVGVAIYGSYGDLRREGTLHGVEFDPSTEQPLLHFDVGSSGNAHVRMRGQFAVWRRSEFPGVAATTEIVNPEETAEAIPEQVLDFGLLPAFPVLPGTRRVLTARLARKLPPGEYMLDINGELSGERLDTAIPFSAEGPSVARNLRD
ncbi:MAG: molecular chaperone [bacterium]|nr:molecular chaperone [bacterium]